MQKESALQKQEWELSLEFETEPNCLLIKAESNITLLCQKQPTWSHELNLSEWQRRINNVISTQYIWRKYRSLTWFVL